MLGVRSFIQAAGWSHLRNWRQGATAVLQYALTRRGYFATPAISAGCFLRAMPSSATPDVQCSIAVYSIHNLGDWLDPWPTIDESGRQLVQSSFALGTGGVAIFALQIAKMAGARAIITSSSDAKLERARALGADEVINYKTTPDWEKKVLELTDGQGAEHVIDTGGVGTLPKSYVAVGPAGVVSVIGVMTRPEGDLSPYPLMTKGAMVRGIFVGGREHFDALMKAVAVTKLTPVVDKTFDFDAAPEAFKYLKSAQHFGKVVIKI